MQILESIDRLSKRLINLTTVLLFFMMVLWLAAILVIRLASLTVPHALQQAYAYTALALLCLLLLAATLRLTLSFFLPSEEDNPQPPQTISNHHKPSQTTTNNLKQSQTTTTQPLPILSPLQNLNEAQEAAVCDLLRRLPTHISKAGHINMAVMAHYLTALRNMGFLDDTDRNNLRLWVAQTTNLQVPPVHHFNEAFPSNVHTKVNKARERITQTLEEIR